jgi:glycosyltransferase involved in cell wall biosynthesis
MRITFVIGPFYPVPAVLGSGVEKSHLALAEEMARLGHTVTMISRTYGDFPKEEMRHGVRHIRVSSWDAPRSRLLFRIYDLFYSLRVARILPDSDVTITNSVFLPLVLPRRRAGHIYVHAARFPKGQMWLYWRADRIQAVSSVVAEAILEQTPILRNRVCAIPPPIVDPFAALAPPEKLKHRPHTILFVGRIAEEKGLHVLIESFARLARGPLSGFTLQIVGPHTVSQGGDGPGYRERLEMLAAPAAGAVVFRGFVEDFAKLRAIYEDADIFVYPSLAEKGESFGMAPLEAMAAGCRVVVSDLACFREYLEPGKNGVVFDHRHNAIDALTRALTKLAVDENPIAMRKAAIATVGRFLIEPVTKLYLDDFAALTGKR